MEKFLVTYDNRIMLNLRSIASFHKVVIYPDADATNLGDNEITESGIYVELFSSNTERYFPIATRQQIDLIAEVDLDEVTHQAINEATEDADEYKWLLNMVISELRSKLSRKVTVIDMWDVILVGLKSYHQCLQEDKKREDGFESSSGDTLTSYYPTDSEDMGVSTPIIFSQRIAARFHSDRALMDHVLLSQERFHNGDWGDVSNKQYTINTVLKSGAGTAGRYPTGSKEPAIIITDKGTEFTVRYEDEPEQ